MYGMLIIALRACQFEIESRLVQQRLSLPRILGPSRLASPLPCTPDRRVSSSGKISCSIQSHHKKKSMAALGPGASPLEEGLELVAIWQHNASNISKVPFVPGFNQSFAIS